MAFNEDVSFIEYNVDQPTQAFVTNFDTIGGTTDVVLITVDGVLTDTAASSYTAQQVNHTTWRVAPEVPTGSVVRLYRVTNIDEMVHVFTAGAKFIARNMDNNFKQIRHAQQEVRDAFDFLEYNTLGVVEAAKDATALANDAAEVAYEAATHVTDKIDRHEGAALPYDPSLPYLEGAVVVKDGVLQQWKGGVWVNTNAQEVKKYLLAAGVAESELEGDYNYLMQRLAQIAVDKGWDASFINYNGINQKTVNDGLNSISELVSIHSPKDGMSIKVKSYSADLQLKGGGIFTFIKDDETPANNVNIFAGNGGNWYRMNWKQPSIYDAGLTGNEEGTSLVNNKLQALVDAATNEGLSISLKGKTLKFTQLDLPSDLHIYNGTMDATASNWHLTYGRGAMMFKTTPRNNVGIDYEQQSNYAALEETKNIKFVNVKFKAIEKIGYFYKFDGLKFINCGGEWETRHLFKLIGGYHGTPLISDTPTSYNLINPINGRCKNILIKSGKWKGGYINHTFASPFHFVACEEVDIERPTVDAPLGYHIDIYNRNFRVNQANYHNTNAQIVSDIVSGTAEPDMLAVYIGQNCYDIEVNGGNWTDFGKKGLYIEVGSKVTIDGVIANMTIPNSDTTFIDIQANYRDNTNTYWGNCADITIRNVKSRGTKYGINTSPFNSVRSIKELNVFNADIQTYDILQGVVLRGVDTYSLTDVRSKGQLFIGGNNIKGVVKGGSFHNAANYALYIDDLLTGELPEIKNTDFLTGSGAVIYNNGGAAKYGKIIGGTIYALDTVSSIILNGAKASNLTVMDFEYNGGRHIIHPYTLTVAAGAKTSFYYNDGRFKSGWSCVANIINSDAVGDLDIRANVLSGSIYVTIENKSGKAINALPINIVLKLGTFASRAYPN